MKFDGFGARCNEIQQDLLWARGGEFGVGESRVVSDTTFSSTTRDEGVISKHTVDTMSKNPLDTSTDVLYGEVRGNYYAITHKPIDLDCNHEGVHRQSGSRIHSLTCTHEYKHNNWHNERKIHEKKTKNNKNYSNSMS